MSRVVWFNARGNRIGEGHQRAKLSDADVDLIYALREEGMSLGRIAEKFECAKSTVRDICTGRIRGQACVRIKRLPDAPAPNKKAHHEHHQLDTPAG
ncbi:MAG: helix-turn-helix domain-containing protein [Methylotenera sp.]|nr:helix-turn-helix domain-containing protein [Methylotenera sp.]